MNLGALVAPFLAGIVYAKAGYYAVFGMILGLIGVDFVLRGVMIEKKTARKWLLEDQWSPSTAVFDPESGSRVSEDSSTCGVDSSSQATGDEQNEMQSDSPTETSPLLKKPWDEKKAQSWFKRRFPRMTILLKSPRMRAAFLGCFTHTTLTACFDTVLPLFVKHTFHWNSTGAGLIFLCLTVPTVLGTFVGQLSDRFGPRKMSLIGFVLTIPTLALMGLIQDDAMGSKIGLCVLLVLIGKLQHSNPILSLSSHPVFFLYRNRAQLYPHASRNGDVPRSRDSNEKVPGHFRKYRCVCPSILFLCCCSRCSDGGGPSLVRLHLRRARLESDGGVNGAALRVW